MKHLVLFFIMIVTPAIASDWQGRCIHVADGDTITVLTDKNLQVKIRLYGVDSPESGQDFGNRAKQFTHDFAHGQTVIVKPIENDRYGRTVAYIEVA